MLKQGLPKQWFSKCGFSWCDNPLVSTVQASGAVRCLGYWNILACLTAVDHVYSFMTGANHLLMTPSSFITHHVAKLKSSQTGLLNMTAPSSQNMKTWVMICWLMCFSVLLLSLSCSHTRAARLWGPTTSWGLFSSPAGTHSWPLGAHCCSESCSALCQHWHNLLPAV